MNLKVGEIYPASVTFKNDHGVFVDAGNFNICLALRKDLPFGYYDVAKGGDKVTIRVLSIDEKNRYWAEVIKVGEE